MHGTPIHVQKNKECYLLAADTVENATYMDDSMDSVVDDQQAIELYGQLKQLYKKANMHPHKWLSNLRAVLEQIPSQERASEVLLDDGQLPSMKMLGLLLLVEEDVFTFIGLPPKAIQLTKRTFLKKIASLFDPIGFLDPFVIQAKLVLQELWICGLEWDEELDEKLQERAIAWFQQFEGFEHYSNSALVVFICRVHGFVDLAYICRHLRQSIWCSRVFSKRL